MATKVIKVMIRALCFKIFPQLVGTDQLTVMINGYYLIMLTSNSIHLLDFNINIG
uniref:Uncharacterized protein n=1 Tax=Borrelia hermsii TaxID=140 RepID=S4VN15_BORHE|nr:hypothetical protein BHA028 [Borrelia hermsii]